ncbi:MAG TPA: hypothetical protein VKB19_12280 [Pedobacter sp.]|nr:hypothetical protein [Pedobacter sp.]
MDAYTAYTDGELAALLKEGDQYAYTEIYHRYEGLVYLFTYRRLAVCDWVRTRNGKSWYYLKSSIFSNPG